jgi:hypothetical protein
MEMENQAYSDELNCIVTKGPLAFIKINIHHSLKNFSMLFKNPKLLIPIIVLSVFWFLLSYLKIAFPNSTIVTIMSFLTFSQGGMYGGLFGALGGIVGKAFFAWFFTMLFAPKLKAKQKMKRDLAFGSMAYFIMGFGLAFILHNFFTGNGRIENSMISLVALSACIKASTNETSFSVNLVRSFSKGKLGPQSGLFLLRGMALGFLLSFMLPFIAGMLNLTLFEKYIFKGTLWYIIGVIVLVIGFFSLLPGKKKRAIAIFIILMQLSNLAITTISATNFTEPYLAYNQDSQANLANLNLTNKMNDAPPAAMELTLVATGRSDFSLSAPLKNRQKILAENGSSPTFTVTSQQLSNDRYTIDFSATITLIQEADGWYAQTNTSYEITTMWTDGKPIIGTENAYEKCYFILTEDGVGSYIYDPYREENGVYLSIPVSFSYVDKGTLEGSSWAGDTWIMAKVDGVSLTQTTQKNQTQTTGAWVLTNQSTYRTVLMHYDTGEYETQVFDRVYDNSSADNTDTVSVNGSVITYQSNVFGDAQFETTFDPAPPTLKADELLTINMTENSIYNGSALSDISTALFLAGKRPTQFFVDQEVGNILGDNLTMTIFEKNGDRYSALVPKGQTEGDVMTLEYVLSTNSMGLIILGNEYVWDATVITEATTDPGEDDESLFPWDSDTGDDSGAWESDWTDFWNEHADPAETAIINAIAIALTLIASGGGAAGAFSPSGSNAQEKIVIDPATGAESRYTKDPSSGEWVSGDGRSTLDPEKLSQWEKERKVDRSVSDSENKKQSDRTDRNSREVDRHIANDTEKRNKAAFEQKMIDKYGATDGDDAFQKIQHSKWRNELSAEYYQNLGNRFNNALIAAERIELISDTALDGLSAVVPGGNAIRAGYKITKNTLKGVSEGYNTGKNNVEIAVQGFRGFIRGSTDAASDFYRGDSVSDSVSKYLVKFGGEGFYQTTDDQVIKNGSYGEALGKAVFNTGLEFASNKIINKAIAMDKLSVRAGKYFGYTKFTMQPLKNSKKVFMQGTNLATGKQLKGTISKDLFDTLSKTQSKKLVNELALNTGVNGVKNMLSY